MADRTTISVSQAAYDALATEKREGESFSDVVLRVCGDSETVEAPAPSVELPDDVLTEAHIEDIAARSARKTADEVENRLTRR